MYQTPQTQALQDIIDLAAYRKSKKRLARKLGIQGLILTALQFWFSQLVVWGLSLFHIDSGIWGVWLIMEAISTLLVGCIRLGMLQTIQDQREVDFEK